MYIRFLLSTHSHMSSEFFINKLEEIYTDTKNQGKSLQMEEVFLHATKYLDVDSAILTESGKHVFAMGDNMHHSAMGFIFDKIKYRDLWYVDSDSYSPLHYAAMHDITGVFDHAIKYHSNIGKTKLKKLALHLHPITKHSTSSILISNDNTHVLHDFLIECLSISPFESEFHDIYCTWLHDAISCDSKKTALYLYRNHKDAMKEALRRPVHTNPMEHVTPMDIALLSDSGHFYIDVILASIPHGLKINGVSFTVLLTQVKNMSNILTADINYLLDRCVDDTVFSCLACSGR